MLGQVLSAVTVVPAAANASPSCRTNPGANDPRCPPGQRIHHGADISAPQGSPICDPHGFEPGDDEAPPSTRIVLWAGVALGAGLLVYLMVR